LGRLSYKMPEDFLLKVSALADKTDNEGISIVENASKIGLPIPEKLKNVLAQLREGGESK
jgi:hypothetical protein